MNRLLKPTILSISLLTVMAGAAVSPALGSISKAFPSVSPEMIKMIISLPAITIIVFSYVSGKLAARISKRYILIIGLLMYLLGGLGAALTTTIYQLLFFRAILGVGVGLLMPLSVAIIADFYEGAQRSKMIGLSPAISCLGGVLASFLGGLLAALNWRYAFGIYCLAIPSLLLTIIVLPESPESAEIEALESSPARLPQQVILLACLQFLLMLVFFSVPTNIATFMQDQGIGNAALAGLALAVLNIFGFIGGLMFNTILKKLGKHALLGSIACMTAGFWLLSLSYQVNLLIVSVAILGFGFGILQPLIYLRTTQVVPKQKTPLAMSLISSSLFFGQFMSPILLSLLGSLIGNTGSRFTFHFLSLTLLGALCTALILLLKPANRSK